MSLSKIPVAILISGRGSNMRALVDAAQAPGFPARIVGVVSDKADASGLAFAAERKLPTEIIARADHADKAAHDAAIEAALERWGAQLVCLAGYMRLLTTPFVERWVGRLLNIHPALLPLFKGLDTHARALEAGVRLHGCTVHFVTPAMDEGPIIAQAAVPVLPGDDAERLARRVLVAEHRLYPRALALVAEGLVRMDAGKAVFAPARMPVSADRVLSSLDGDLPGIDVEALARETP